MSATQPYSMSRSRSRTPSRKRSRSRSVGRGDDRNMVASIIVKPGRSSGPTYKFTRWADAGAIYSTTNSLSSGTVITSGSSDIIYQGFGYLSLLPNYAEFQALFSRYRVTEMEFHFINCMFTDVVGQSNGINGTNSIRNFPVYIGAQQDTLGTTTIAQIQQEENCTVRDYVNQGKPFIVKVRKPTFVMPATDGLGVSIPQSVETNGEWIDTNSPDIPYRGVFLGCQDAWNALGQPTIANRAFTIRIKLTLEFKGVR